MIADYYVPPKEKIDPPAIFYVAEKTHMDSQDFNIKKGLFFQKPTESDYEDCAKAIQEIFEDGFQWHDIADMMKLSIQYLNKFLPLSLEEKRQGVITIINNIIDNTDTPYLPDYFFDPIFKALAEAFVKVVIPDSINDLIPFQKISGELSSEEILDFVTNIKNTFENNFQWQDIATVTADTIRFVNQFVDTTTDEKKETAKNIIGDIIEKTDIPYIPDSFADSLLKNVSDGFVDGIIDAVDSISIF